MTLPSDPSDPTDPVDPIEFEFEVDCSPEHAFAVWTQRISQWWPADHTVTGDAELTVVMEPRVGGRIFERTTTAAEHDWGAVTAWEPPARLAYTWHLRRDPTDATDVEIRFQDAGDGRTTVRIEHRGWERLGAEGRGWRDRNYGGWSSLLPHFVRAISPAAAAD